MNRKKVFLYNSDLLQFDYDNPNQVSYSLKPEEMLQPYPEQQILVSPSFNLLLITHLTQENILVIKYFSMASNNWLFTFKVNQSDMVSNPAVWWMNEEPVSFVIMKNKINLLRFYNQTIEIETFFDTQSDTNIYLAQPMPQNQAAFVTESSIIVMDMYLNNTLKICEQVLSKDSQKNDIAYNKVNQKIQMVISYQIQDSDTYQNVIAIADIDSCMMKFYNISLEGKPTLSKQFFSTSLVYLNYGINLYVYDLESQLGKILNSAIFFKAPIRQFDNYLYILEQGIIHIYQIDKTSVFRHIDLSPYSITDFTYFSEQNELIVLVQKEIRIYDFNTMTLIKFFPVQDSLSMFFSKNSSQIYIVESNFFKNSQVRIIDTYSNQISDAFDIPDDQNYHYYEYNLDENSNLAFAINSDYTLMSLDMRIVQNQIQKINQLSLFLYITGKDESNLQCLYSRNSNHVAITESIKSNVQHDDVIDEFYNIDQQGILSYIDSLNNKYKQILILDYSKFHLVVKKFSNPHYALVANDFHIYCLQQEVVLDTYTIDRNKEQSLQLMYLFSNQENLFLAANNTIFDIQYSFDLKKIILKPLASLSNDMLPIDIISKVNTSVVIYANENTLFLTQDANTQTYQLEGNVFCYFQKMKQEMFAAVTDLMLLVYSFSISTDGIYSLVMKTKIKNNQILQFYQINTRDIIISEDSLKRIALYSIDDSSQNSIEYQSIPYPCYSGNKILLSVSSNNYFAVSCNLQTNIYKQNSDTLVKLSLEMQNPSSNYFTVVKTFKGIQMKQFLIQELYIFCSSSQSLIVLDKLSLLKIYEINLTRFTFLKIIYLGKEQIYDKFFIKGVQDYQRITFQFLINNSTNNTSNTNYTNTDQRQLPLCYVNMNSTLPKKDQIQLFNDLVMYKSILNQQVQKTILQINLIEKIQLIDELQSDSYELKVFQDKSNSHQIELKSIFNIKKQDIQYSGINFQFPDNFNLTVQNRKKVAIQNSHFSSNTLNSGIFFSNMSSLIVSNVTFEIENILNKYQRNQAFIFFNNISEIILSNISISSIKKIQYKYFLRFTSIKNYIMISYLNLSDITVGNELQNFVLIQSSNYLQISNVKAFDIFSASSFFQKSLLSLQGVQSTYLSNIQANNIQNISFFFYTNYFFLFDRKVYLAEDILIFANIHFSNCQYKFSLIWIFSNTFQLIGESNSFQNISNINAEGGVFKIQGSYVNITNTQFINNSAAKGGAVCLMGIVYFANFQNCLFERNQASQFGGAIYQEDTYLLTFNTTIRNNQALIGGGIYYTGIKVDDTSILKSNDAEIYGKNIASNILISKIQMQCEEDCIIQNNNNSTRISNFRSGGTLSFFFEVLDEENNMININKQQFNDYPIEIQKEIAKIKINAIANYQDLIKLSNQQSSSYLDYNQDTKLIELPLLKVAGNPNKDQKIELISSFTQIMYGQNETTYNYSIQFSFRNCQPGETQVQIDNIIQCIPCPLGFYSLVTTFNQISVECTICPPSAFHCEKNLILLKDGYWRSNELTDNIYYCENEPSNCKGSKQGNRFYCDEGKVGPLCESCDIYQKVWDTKYMKSDNYDCIKCNDVQNKTFILPLIGIFFFIIAYVIFSINMSIKMSKRYSYSYYFRMSKILVSNKSSMQDISSFYFKILLNYIQISMVTNNYYLTLPPILAYFPDILSLPLQRFLNIFDCQFSLIEEDVIPLVFLRVLWSYFLPLIFLIIIIIVYSILFCIQKCVLKYKDNKTLQNMACLNITTNSNKKMMVYHLYNGLFFLLIFMQPSQVQILLSTLSCKEIDGQMFIASDLTFECYTKNHGFFIAIMIVPGLLLWIFVIPLIILYLLRKNSHRLDSLQVRFSFGFLYQEYKSKYYYWEFVKSYFKIGVVLIGTFLNQARVAKLIIICLILFIYQYITSKVKPYVLIKLNNLDFMQINVLVIIALFNAFVENPPNHVFKNIVIVLTIIIHNAFLLVNISIAIFLKIESKFSMQINRLKTFLKVRIPFFFKYLDIKKPINLIRVNKNWKKVITFVEKTNFKNNLENILYKGQKQNKFSINQNEIAPHFKDLKLSINKKIETIKLNQSPNKKQNMSELFQFHSTANKFSKNPTSHKSLKNVSSLSDIKEEDSQFDAFKMARSQSITESKRGNDPKNIQNDDTNIEQNSSNLQQKDQNQESDVRGIKKFSGDNTSLAGDDHHRTKLSSKNLLQSQQENNSFNSIQNSQNAKKKNKSIPQKGFKGRFIYSQSRQTTQPGTPSQLLLSQALKKQAASQSICNNKTFKSTDEIVPEQQKIDYVNEIHQIDQFSSQNIDLVNSRIAFSNSNIKNIQSLENSVNFNQQIGSQTNFYNPQTKQKPKKKKDQIKYTSSSSLESSSEESSEKDKNNTPLQQMNQYQLQISQYQNNQNELISPSELVDNTVPLKFQSQNITLDLQKVPQTPQNDLSSKNFYIQTPNINQFKLIMGDSSQIHSNSKISINNLSPEIQKIELINFEQTSKQKEEQCQDQLVNFDDSGSSQSN